MEKFAKLFQDLEQTKSTKDKVQKMSLYFQTTPSKDAAWALFFLCGNRIKRLITGRMLFDWCMEALSIPSWLMLESYSAVGDTAETIALLLQSRSQNSPPSPLPLSDWMEKRILPLHGRPSDWMKETIFSFWDELDTKGIFLLNKILSGTLRIGVSQLLTIQALSHAFSISKEVLAQKLMGNWEPSALFFESLKESIELSGHLNPYPFYLASPLEGDLNELGETNEWSAEWKWDGIRAQGIQRGRKTAIWSRGNELITHQFPEIEQALARLPDGTVLDGEILAFQEGRPLPFGELQKRLGRKKVSSTMTKQVPIVFMIYDILENDGKDIRKLPFLERRALIEKAFPIERIHISPTVSFSTWEELQQIKEEAKSNGAEGLVLKKKNSAYGVGRRRGSWWKYKIEPKTIDAILMYAQTGQGWRANLYTDYTFGVWHDQEIVPIAKAYSGLKQEEIDELDKWIRKNTVEKFGPVRRVKPEQVFEIAFEGIQASKRHKSGVAVRFPRIQRWRKDKPPEECDSLEGIKKSYF
ncbi:MAG: ATP-dependent DNA ligase [Parachlamydia sp.]|nr:ATP-dependent DNA ligase [Parachlamydia sp.]